MSDVSPAVPSFSTFVRDQLAEHCDALGHFTDTDDRDGFPCLSVEASDGSSFEDLAVTADGRLMSMVDGWREVRLPGFTWHPEPSDTGHQHGPAPEGERWWYGAAEWDGRRNPADIIGRTV